MRVTLDELQIKILLEGATDEYQNGANQCGLKKSSEADVYNGMIKNYNSTLKQISDLFPADNKAESGDPLMAFLKK